MANGHGGYRKPSNPAPVSGPGAHSRRTDGQPSMQLSNAAYGEQSQFQDIQSGAKMSNSGVQNSAPVEAGSGPAAPIVGMGAPSQQPDVPVTAGADKGPGPGPEAIGIRGSQAQDAEALRKYLPTLIDIAQRDDTLPGTKQWIRSVVASLG